MELSPQTSSSNDISSTGEGGNNDEMGKQIIDLIERLINEADPETEKIKVEFTFTPFKAATSKTIEKLVNPPMSQIVTASIELSHPQTKSIASKNAHRRQEKSSKERKPKKNGSSTLVEMETIPHQSTTPTRSASLISSASSKSESTAVSTMSSLTSSSAPKKVSSSAISNLSYSNYQNLLQIVGKVVDKQRSESSKKASSTRKSKKRH